LTEEFYGSPKQQSDPADVDMCPDINSAGLLVQMVMMVMAGL